VRKDEALVAMFENAFGREPKEIELGVILRDIRGGKYAREIGRIRELLAIWKSINPSLDDKASPQAKAYEEFKRGLPAFCVSGTARGRKEALNHSGLLQVDLDNLGEVLIPLREKLKKDPHIAFGFLSPSGNGLKLGLVIDGARHTESFEAARRYFLEKYSVEIDEKVKDRLRLCFVSHDPELWTMPDALPLPILECEKILELPSKKRIQPGVIVLPSGNVSTSDSARDIFQLIAPTRTLFYRGGAVVELVEEEGVAGLVVLKPDAFRSRVERYGRLFAWRSDSLGKPVLKPINMSRDTATAIMEAAEARNLLPPVASVLRFPVLLETGDGVTILGPGYHSEQGGLLIVNGDEPPRVEISEAVNSLKRLIEQFDFQTEGDRSRALAAFITPALRAGGFFTDKMAHVPIDVAEADKSQAGKGFRHSLVCALYNEAAYYVTSRNGGVGSIDESFAAALISGRPFICLDNFRGKLDSQHLEAFLTCPDLFPVRVPYRGEVRLNPKRFLLQLTSNGLEATRDLANRASFCRIRKREGFMYRDTLSELERSQPYFLGCVFAVIVEWIRGGKGRTDDTRHDFREWNQTLDWIVQNIFGCAPLMDGHPEAQDRVSSPARSWLRALALAADRTGTLGHSMIASELVELCQIHGLDIPGVTDADEDRAKRQVGMLMRRLFESSDEIIVDGYRVNRGRKEYRKPSGDADWTPNYTFTK
jgi:hypothetical protein